MLTLFPSPLPALAPGSPVSTRSSSPRSQCLPGHPVTAGTSPGPGQLDSITRVFILLGNKTLARTFAATQDNHPFNSLWGLLPWLASVLQYSSSAPCRIPRLKFSPRGKYGARGALRWFPLSEDIPSRKPGAGSGVEAASTCQPTLSLLPLWSWSLFFAPNNQSHHGN